jgi:glycine/D-amino acid oxidase-like deaminating enzyme
MKKYKGDENMQNHDIAIIGGGIVGLATLLP